MEAQTIQQSAKGQLPIRGTRFWFVVGATLVAATVVYLLLGYMGVILIGEGNTIQPFHIWDFKTPVSAVALNPIKSVGSGHGGWHYPDRADDLSGCRC